MKLNVLLDSTYILPTFGIEVEGLTDEDIKNLREICIMGKVKFYCSPVIWIEVLGKLYRESIRKGINIENIINKATKSLLESNFYTWIQPSPQAIELAFKLRSLGHKDNIDNLLYAISITNNMIFLTMDTELKNFLQEHNIETKNIIDHHILLKKLT